MNLRFSLQAAEDLESIGDFIAEDNPARANSFVEELQERCQEMSRHPTAFPLRAELEPGLRIGVHGKYLIFFKSTDEEMLVVRILHGARDLTKLLKL